MGSLGRAIGYLKPYWLLAAGIFISLIIATMLNLVIPLITGRIIDEGIDAGVARYIMLGALAMVGVALLRALFSFTQNFWAAKASQNVAYDMRNATTIRSRIFPSATTTGRRRVNCSPALPVMWTGCRCSSGVV